MLQVNPKMLPRLAEVEKDLALRRKRAEEKQWLGEIEGIDMTLTFVRTKQADSARPAQRSTSPWVSRLSLHGPPGRQVVAVGGSGPAARVVDRGPPGSDKPRSSQHTVTATLCSHPPGWPVGD